MEKDRLEILGKVERGEIAPEEAARILGGEPPEAPPAGEEESLEDLLAGVKQLESSIDDLEGDVGDVSARLEKLRSHIEAFRAKVARIKRSTT
jgi:peptidoglycan hydrolase CwlO-like protein